MSMQKKSSTVSNITHEDRLLKIVADWVSKNRKVFWKYEVSCFYKPYMIRICNLPEPLPENILISSNNRLFSDTQRKKLCDAISKSYTRTEQPENTSIDIRVNYIEGNVNAEILSRG